MSMLVRLSNVLAAILVLAGIWYPVWTHFHVDSVDVSTEEMTRLQREPDDGLMSRLAPMETTFALDLDENSAVSIARQLERGEFVMPGVGAATFGLPFDGRDYTAISEPFKLRFASLHVPLILLIAYEYTGDETHFDLARKIILGWAQHDRSSFLPQGLQYNDHAIASRAYVLTRFWARYRNHADFDAREAQIIVEAVMRTAQYLAKPSHYMAATNHGVMQNLALLHLASAFPALDKASDYRDIALDRLADQLTYYVSDEGMILEHSAGYQQYGINLLADYASYLAIMNRPMPEELAAAYANSLEVYASLRRRDGTLPKIGDTMGPAGAVRVVDIDAAGNRSTPRPWRPLTDAPASRVLPVSGLAALWHGAGNEPDKGQLVMTWSRFPSMAHKHADDLSITLWNPDGAWIAGVGYWPYWSPQRKEAISWPASNAPHFRGEKPGAKSASELLGQGVSSEFAFLDVRRVTEQGGSLRRQLAWLPDGSVIVIDAAKPATSSNPSDFVVVWTGAPDLGLRKSSGADQYSFERVAPRSAMHVAVSSDQPLNVQSFVGSNDPFRGWTSDADVATPAPAIEVAAGNPGWILSQFSFLQKAPDDAGIYRMLHFSAADDWELGIESGEPVRLRRSGDILTWLAADAGVQSVSVAAPQGMTVKREKIVRSFQRATDRFPRFRPLMEYRSYASALVIAAALALEFLFLAVRRVLPGFLRTARAVTIAGWFGLYFFLTGVYLV